MKTWIKRILGSRDEPQINTDLNAIDDYVVVNKKDLDRLLAELQELRSRDVKTDARDLDLLLGDMEAENKALRALVDSYRLQSNPDGLKKREDR
jgi:hypothetical protein